MITAAPSIAPAAQASSAASASLEREGRHVRAHGHARREVEELDARRRA